MFYNSERRYSMSLGSSDDGEDGHGEKDGICDSSDQSFQDASA